ncbi:MAG: YceI family protein, partial [Calditrichaeota bacterium]
VKATIKSASIDTDNQKRDEHLVSGDFLDAQNYPEITFESNNIRKTEDGFIATGMLTIRGITKEMELPFKMLGPINDPWGNKKIGIEAAMDINRFDYNVKWNNTLDTGSLVVSDNVKIKLDLQLVKEAGSES